MPILLAASKMVVPLGTSNGLLSMINLTVSILNCKMISEHKRLQTYTSPSRYRSGCRLACR